MYYEKEHSNIIFRLLVFGLYSGNVVASLQNCEGVGKKANFPTNGGGAGGDVGGDVDYWDGGVEVWVGGVGGIWDGEGAWLVGGGAGVCVLVGDSVFIDVASVIGVFVVEVSGGCAVSVG